MPMSILGSHPDGDPNRGHTIEQVPRSKTYLHDPSGESRQVRNFEHMLKMLNHILTTAPKWTDAGHKVGLVGVPVNALLDWPMGTKAGFVVFQDPKVNAMVSRSPFDQIEGSSNLLIFHLPISLVTNLFTNSLHRNRRCHITNISF